MWQTILAGGLGSLGRLLGGLVEGIATNVAAVEAGELSLAEAAVNVGGEIKDVVKVLDTKVGAASAKVTRKHYRYPTMYMAIKPVRASRIVSRSEVRHVSTPTQFSNRAETHITYGHVILTYMDVVTMLNQIESVTREGTATPNLFAMRCHKQLSLLLAADYLRHPLAMSTRPAFEPEDEVRYITVPNTLLSSVRRIRLLDPSKRDAVYKSTLR